jgi:hypothetical protein
MPRRTLALLGALTLTFTAANCGAGKDDESGAAADPSGSVEGSSGDAEGDLDAVDAGAGGDTGGVFADPAAAAAYCGRKADLQTGSAPETGLADWEALQEVAPNEIRDDIDVVVDGYREAVAEGDPDAPVDVEAPGPAAALQNIFRFDVANCPT